MPNNEKWEEEFDKEFSSIFDDMGAYGVEQGIKDFISQIRHQAQVEILREVLPEGYELPTCSEGADGYNDCRQQIIDKAKEKYNLVIK